MRGVKLVTGAAAAVLLLAYMGPMPALADTIEAALVRAYQSNPQLNAQRAQVRSTDENVPQALSGYRPKVAVTASGGYQYQDNNSTSGGTPTAIVRTEIHGANAPRSAGVTVSQTLFQWPADRQQDPRGGEPGLGRARSLAGARTDRAALGRHDLHGLLARLRHRRGSEEQRARSRTDAEADPRSIQCGRSDAHDVAQSEAQLAAGRTQLLAAEATLTTTKANFRRIIGNEPEALAPGSPVDRFLPGSLPGAVDVSLIENPNVTAAMFGIDVNYLQVKVNEGALLPTVSLQASAQQSYEQTMTVFRSFSAAAVAQLSVPIYQGGAEYSLIRQSKETLAQQRLNLDQTRDQVRANTVHGLGASWWPARPRSHRRRRR